MNQNISRTPVRYIKHKGVNIPVFGVQKSNRTFVTSSGLIRAALCIIPLAGALFTAWIVQG